MLQVPSSLWYVTTWINKGGCSFDRQQVSAVISFSVCSLLPKINPPIAFKTESSERKRVAISRRKHFDFAYTYNSKAYHRFQRFLRSTKSTLKVSLKNIQKKLRFIFSSSKSLCRINNESRIRHPLMIQQFQKYAVDSVTKSVKLASLKMTLKRFTK